MEANTIPAPASRQTDDFPQPTSRARPQPALEARAVLFTGDSEVDFADVAIATPGPEDLVIDVEWSGVSTGTERLLWAGEMPPFPGLAYPLVPGYEAVGRVIWAGDREDLIGERVFAPGSRGFKDVHGLFGASASRIVTAADRVAPVRFARADEACLLALAATARHAIAGGTFPDLIIGHGALGRLLARISMAMGGSPPVVWEIDPERSDGAGYAVMDPACDGRSDYKSIYDASGDPRLLDELIAHLAPGGEIVLAGFYADRLSFDFAPAFMREMRMRIAAEWRREDLDATIALVDEGALDLSGLITHRLEASAAGEAYRTAFGDPGCLKMILDWRRSDERAL